MVRVFRLKPRTLCVVVRLLSNLHLINVKALTPTLFVLFVELQRSDDPQQRLVTDRLSKTTPK